MFNLETAIKAFFWSAILYEYTDDGEQTFKRMPAQMSSLIGGVTEAMQLLGLQHRRLFHDKLLETKIVVAWGGHRVLVCARGTAARANVSSDAKVRSARVCSFMCDKPAYSKPCMSVMGVDIACVSKLCLRWL